MAADIAGFISRSSNLSGIQPLKNGENVMKTEKNSKKAYGKVIISLENCLLPAERLATTPSHKDGLDPDTEMDLRIVGCELIQTAGILLRLPQVAMATGQVLFQRFYYSKSFVRHPMEVTAMGCVCLASKIEEAPRRVRDVISVFHHIKQVKAGRNITPVLLDQNYINLKNQVIKAERRVLKELGFCVHVKHPHKIIFSYLQQLGFLSRDSSNTMGPRMLQQAWNYMNDSLRTDVFLRYSPETIACACIYFAARQLKQALPSNPAWFSIYDCLEDDLKEISVMILKLYQRPKADPEKLERMVNNLQKAYQDARQKNRGGVGVADSKPGTPSKLEGGSDGFSSPRPKKDRRDESHGRRRSRSYDRKRRSSSGADSPSPRRDKKRRRSRSRSDSRKRLEKDHGRSRDERHAKDRRRGKENDRSFSRSLSPDRKSHKHKAKRDVSRRNDHKGRRSKDAEKKKDKKR